VLTASASIADCVEAMQAGAFNFLVKPLNRDELRKVVSSALLAARPQSHSADEAQPGAGQPQAASSASRRSCDAVSISLTTWRPPTRPCCCWAKVALARKWSRD